MTYSVKSLLVCIGTGVFLISWSSLCLPDAVWAADSAFKPFVSITEEVTDNIYEKADGRRIELTSRVRPGATFRYQSPLWTWDTAYTFEYRSYARDSKEDEYAHDGAVKGNIALVDNLLFLDLTDTYRRVTLDVTRNAATESSLFLNQTDQNTATFSPYLLWRMRGDNTLKTGYRYTDTSYRGGGINKQEHRGYTDLTHDVTSKFSLTGGLAYTRLESLPSQYNKQDVSGGFKYEYADKSSVSGQIGNSWQQYDSGLNVNYLFWNVGITHDFIFAVGNLETKVLTPEDPLAVSTRETTYSARLDKILQRGMIGGSVVYSEYVNTATDVRERRKLGFTASGRYEVIPDVTASLTTTAERFSRKTVEDYPYRFTGTGGLNFAFNKEFTLGLTYTYVTERYALRLNGGASEVNKAVMEIKKVF